MSYKEISENIIKDINTRKEFFSLNLDEKNPYDIAGIIKNSQIKKYSESIVPRFILKKEIEKGNFLRIHSYQTFISNYINPNTPYKRLLVKWDTGVGKTLGAISLAMNFINYYRKEDEIGSLEIGSVFILGFNKAVFQKEFIKYPEFGFISRNEISILNNLKKMIKRGTKSDIDNLNNLMIKIKKRFTNRKRNGFFKFYGYREFVNRIFLPNEQNIDMTKMTEYDIIIALKEGKIKFNSELLDSFKNSLLICDEIHNVYNSLYKNNWGIAIQSVLDYTPSLRAIFLSATPLNNNPTEIIDLMNLLIVSNEKLKKEDFFSNIKTGEIKPKSLEKIKNLLQGKVSFIKDTNPLYFPSKKYIGEYIPGVKYLKFIRCPMSDFHYNTYKKIYKGTLSQDSQYIIDFILPNPENKTLGLYRTKDVFRLINNASIKWKEKYHIDINNNMIVGDFLHIDTLKKFSSKYYNMIKNIHEIIDKKQGKIFIYHNIVHMSGVLFIQEILKKNGIISEYGSPSNNTLCTYCNKTLSNHKKQNKKELIHEFNPVRFIIAHSNLDKITINKSIERYNNPDNTDGHNIMILVGSRLIKESYNIIAIQNVFIMGRPDNIPTLIQIVGRSVRKYSHILLPINKRNVNIKIFTTCLPIKNKKTKKYELSYEEIKYKEKILSYDIIRQIERKFHECAIDITINIKNKSKDFDPLSPFDFDPCYKLPKNYKISDINLNTFDTFYKDDEEKIIISLIKRLFIEQDVVWTYEQLFDAVKNPPSEWEINVKTNLFYESIFQIALTKLLWSEREKFGNYGYIEPLIERSNFTKKNNEDKFSTIIESMNNPNDKVIILPNGNWSVIIQRNIFYCLIPLDIDTLEPIIDIEMPYRVSSKNISKKINIKNYLSEKIPNIDYNRNKIKFKSKYQYLDLDQMESAICDYGSDFHQLFIEEAITYIFNIFIGKRKNMSEFHEFYFKMLYYYDIIGIVIWANTVKDILYDKYKKFIINNKDKKNKLSSGQNNNIIEILESSINKSGCNWCPEEIQKEYYKSITESEKFTINIKKKDNLKISANLLPVGHFIKKIPRFYDIELPEPGWIDVPSYINKITKDWKENNIIIGYDVKSETGIYIRFKIRSPIHSIKQFKDTRKIEKGSTCNSKSKQYLLEICNKLKIELPKKINISILCNKIREKLIYNEIKERKKENSNIKWFYGYYEKIPKFL